MSGPETLNDFLLELRSEEIPARMQAGARAELEKLFRREMDAAGVSATQIAVWSTPRRLALIARGLPEATDAVSEELKGPPVGAPDQAIEGFCRKAGVERSALEERDVKGRATWFAVKDIPGRATRDLLAAAIPAIIRDFSWPRSMRWGVASVSTESLRWVRPLSGIVALLGDEVIECEVHGVTSGAVTLGHRFHHSGDITIGNAGDYAMKLRAAHVIVDHEERAELIRKGAHQVAEEAGLALVEDEGLVVENAGLTEWPIPLLGRFEESFLEVPPEVIQLTARVNQKYFVCEGAGGKLANAFICTANIEAADGGAAIVDGNRKVLAARLSDARFFWDVDRKKTLAQHAEGLARITFHEKLGTVADKVERVAKLARWLVEEGIVKPSPLQGRGLGEGADTAISASDVPLSPEGEREWLAELAEQAARLAKADLVTEMVGEFPELQGLMGGYYARAEGLPDEVADAIRDHYKPVGQGDDVPTAPVTVAVSLADKLDTLISFFAIGEKPTGSKDPFALRRAAIGVLLMVASTGFRIPLYSVVDRTNPTASSDERNPMYNGFVAFLADRLKVQQREAGVRHDLIDAVFALGGEDDLVRLLARVKALQTFVATEDGANLLAGYKRAANILKKEDWHGIEGEIPQTGEEDPLVMVDDPELRAVVDAKMAERGAKPLSYTPEPAEKDLIDALDASEPKAEAAIAAEDFASAMSALASLRAPIDAFFDNVTVNDPDPARRQARLALLARFRDAVHEVADFSRIEG
ncbi:glycine--tRNA ligase subunit beta [Qipengyuania spongiae]|uniref:Glycine--tRNA ligase beta subunit n=1 Tax=Qipengyuania spongiae TaxID=2909673 RepID=A0ABY5T0P9_9SPHN|nr:glycine--tRNA ligase subunit beta [Qipengyuania spongiae]UVI38826.1 glycine--tRNA ligase subunit beta [Qipengyuania spongiae]